MKVYIAGPMTGYEDWNRPAFHAAAARLRNEFGYEVVNPAELDYGMTDEELAATPHHVFLHRDIKALLDCDLIYPLPGAQWSKGATLEMTVAAGTGIFTLADPDPAVWASFEGQPLTEDEPDTHPENPDEGVFDPGGPCSELTCPQHGERNRRDAETEALDLLAAKVFVAPVGTSPEDMEAWAEIGALAQGGPFAGMEIETVIDNTMPEGVIRLETPEGHIDFTLTEDLSGLEVVSAAPAPAETEDLPVSRVDCEAVEGDGTGNEWCSHGVQVAWAEGPEDTGGIAVDDDDPHLFPWQQAFARYLYGVLGGGR